MRTISGYRLAPKTQCFAFNKLQLLEYEYHNALVDLEKERISFSILSDVCLPVSMLLLIVIWGYQLNGMFVDSDNGENRTMLLVYGIGLIVLSGTACVYVAMRMAIMRPEKVTTYLPGEVRPFYDEKIRSQRYYYQTIPELHTTSKKSHDILIV